MTVKLDLITPAMDIHAHGCADVARTLKRGRSRTAHTDVDGVQTFEGETIIEAIVAADTDMAALFGQDVYEADPAETPWTVANCQVLPCAAKLMKGLIYDGKSAPRLTGEAPKAEAVAHPCKGKWSTCRGRNAALPRKGWNLCQSCTDARAASRREAAAPVPQIRVETHQYVVEYVTADEAFHRVTLEAIDATDAKHLAESLEGGVVVTASARRVRKAASK